uniref:RNA-directed DNA polymerase n=1 Tax=Oryctolagus cuniculus TaxID=9986 RepID=A0A5F9DAB0_RABIT
MQKSSTKFWPIVCKKTSESLSTHSKWDLSLYSGMVQHSQINMIHHSNKLQKKNHMIISIDAEKAFDKIQYPFMMKTLSKLGIEGTFLNIIKAIYDKPMASILLNGEKLEAFPLRSGTRQGYPLSSLLFNIVLEVIARAIRQEKENKASAAAQLANPPPAALAPQVLVPVGVLDSLPVAPLPVQLSAVAQEGSGGWPKCLGPAPAWETRRKHLAPGFGSVQCASHSVPAVAAIWGVNQQKEDLSLCLSFSLSNSACQKKKKINKNKTEREREREREKKRKKKKTKGIVKEEVKLSLFADDMILYIGDPEDSTKKLLELKEEFGKAAGYKVNTQESTAFVYRDNVTAEKVVLRSIPLTIATKEKSNTLE